MFINYSRINHNSLFQFLNDIKMPGTWMIDTQVLGIILFDDGNPTQRKLKN
jgi:hypothetical protein